MSDQNRKVMKVGVAQNQPEKIKEPQKKEVPEEKLPLWNFPLKGRSVRARNLAEANKKINIKE